MNIMFVQKKLLFQIISLAILLFRVKSKLELQIQPKKLLMILLKLMKYFKINLTTPMAILNII